ncbi:hypothetical protein CFC21_057446, partial [Triticum aestivum]
PRLGEAAVNVADGAGAAGLDLFQSKEMRVEQNSEAEALQLSRTERSSGARRGVPQTEGARGGGRGGGRRVELELAG